MDQVAPHLAQRWRMGLLHFSRPYHLEAMPAAPGSSFPWVLSMCILSLDFLVAFTLPQPDVTCSPILSWPQSGTTSRGTTASRGTTKTNEPQQCHEARPKSAWISRD